MTEKRAERFAESTAFRSVGESRGTRSWAILRERSVTLRARSMRGVRWELLVAGVAGVQVRSISS